MYKNTIPAFTTSEVKAFFSLKGFDLTELKSPYFLALQKHTDIVYVLERPSNSEIIADAVVTNLIGIYIGVQTADCVPILLFDPIKKVVSAVHAGWRGTAKGILPKTISVMKEVFGCNSSDIIVSMGPAIKACCYEVGMEVVDALSKLLRDSQDFVRIKDGKTFVDLHKANTLQALNAGILPANIRVSNYCTYCRADILHSYRYCKSHAGRQYCMISL